MKKQFLFPVLVLGVASILPHPAFAAAGDILSFHMVPSPGAVSCLAYNAYGAVTISDLGPVQNMLVEVFHLPPSTQFDFFVIQVPNAPFGLSRYQADIVTNSAGHGVTDVTGIFGKSTFIVALGVAPAPQVFPDNAPSNPTTNPVQTYHLGIWFDSPTDAAKAGVRLTLRLSLVPIPEGYRS